MSEKRYTLDDDENGLCRCILVDGEEIPTCEICELLNKLSDENNILNKNEDDLKECIIENIKLKEEIEELQEDINDYHNALFDLHKKYDKLEKENDALKKFIKDNFNEMMDSKMVIENEQDY